ncbi:MAG: hypothetical protein ACFFEF_00410, partial [Candidatus Thorarchaeota archaeon]
RFYLVGETERWTLRIDTAGSIIDFDFEDVPCQNCVDYTLFIVAGLAGAIAAIVAIAYVLKIRQR